MKILITGACGFVGSSVISALFEYGFPGQIIGLDNFSRAGSQTNRQLLNQCGVKLIHGDIRCASDIDVLPKVDWVLDAAANPSVLAGLDGQSSSRQVVEHNLFGTINLLEFCRRHQAGFILLSTSRVYSIPALASLPVIVSEAKQGFCLDPKPLSHTNLQGVTQAGVSETFSTAPSISLYGATKLASEVMALEYGECFNLPIWINRCGVLAGGGQFGRADQGILAYWIHSYLRRKKLRYIGFGGNGYQVRDALHPHDLILLLLKQMNFVIPKTSLASSKVPSILNIGGGEDHTFSLAWLHSWCKNRFGFQHEVTSDLTPRPMDIPWMVMDSAVAKQTWSWEPHTSLLDMLEEIALHAEKNPNWLDLSLGN